MPFHTIVIEFPEHVNPERVERLATEYLNYRIVDGNRAQMIVVEYHHEKMTEDPEDWDVEPMGSVFVLRSTATGALVTRNGEALCFNRENAERYAAELRATVTG